MRVCLRRHLCTTLLYQPGRATPQGHYSTRTDIQSQPSRQSIEGGQTHHIMEQSLGDSGIGKKFHMRVCLRRHLCTTLLHQPGRATPQGHYSTRSDIQSQPPRQSIEGVQTHHILEQSLGESGIGKKFLQRVCLRRYLYTTLLYKPGRTTPPGHYSTRSDIQSQRPRQSIEGVYAHHIMAQSLIFIYDI